MEEIIAGVRAEERYKLLEKEEAKKCQVEADIRRRAMASARRKAEKKSERKSENSLGLEADGGDSSLGREVDGDDSVAGQAPDVVAESEAEVRALRVHCWYCFSLGTPHEAPAALPGAHARALPPTL